MKSNKGFTLAEVLITLAIIGVVAALTIPTLIQSSANGKIVAAVRKYQSVLSRAVLRYAVDNGCEGSLGSCGFVDTAGFWTAIKPYFAVAKDCGLAAGEGCFAKGVDYKRLTGVSSSTIYDDLASPKAALNDGSSLSVYIASSSCSSSFVSRSGTGPLANYCGTFTVDINGQKGPNQIGRDLFYFFITKQGVFPKGHFDDVHNSTVAGEPECDPAVDVGLGCLAKILQEGAVNY